ncbi:hypothetical protein CLV47_107106 [Antricoccus suffuscus]|uniref:Spermatogenesis-associated protein 20-like TRX domain-containing protein n=1 Tax=Antricoccus suffuscus TaxID=1629062 RepID=A0A2T1A0X3_9ACTN|nr:thioredoxin domain-containing protein [Antricoccus suffuscus]PRZ41978.1 hypothetical protein CLV47_107106 [Antricoccus suffuscus]
MANRLATSMSPYLQQHADNPVDWWPWGEDALAEARRRDVPVFISIGYAACHWCHVMAHESFEDAETAAQLNDEFVCIKIDREEHPDVDAVYMEATQALTGQGGWPMSVFATADGKPFYCGTYYPTTPMHGLPSFRQLLAAVTDSWRNRRQELDESATAIAAQLGHGVNLGTTEAVSTPMQDQAVARLMRDFDRTNGGFGGAPKFPPATVLTFLLDYTGRRTSPDASTMIDQTCEAMARGGMYDQLAGGFARYSVDATWTVPHFEKMLYDNALLTRIYTHWYRATGSALGRRIAMESADFMLRDLGTAQGGLASALDADTEGEEGLTYVWTPQQIVDVLGDPAACATFGVTEEGTFERGMSVLQLPHDPADLDQYAEAKQALLAARNKRPQPTRDDKVVAAWNGMAITALCELGRQIGEDRYVDAAQRIGDLLLEVHIVDGRVRRVSRDGKAGEATGVLEDYAWISTAFLQLHTATGERRWLDAATELIDVTMEHFAGAGPAEFFDTADDAPALIVRPAEAVDGPTPSGIATFAGTLVLAAALTGNDAYRSTAELICARLTPLVQGAPRAAGWIASVNEALLAGPVQIAVTGPAGADRDRLADLALGYRGAGAVVMVGTPNANSPLLDERASGTPTAYVCRGFVCELPATSEEQLRGQLAALTH